MKWTNEDVKKVEQFIDIRNRGYYCDGKQLTEVYNRVLEKNVAPTNCGSCMRARIQELENALNQFKKQMEMSGMTSTEELVNEIDAIQEELKENKSKKRVVKKKE